MEATCEVEASSSTRREQRHDRRDAGLDMSNGDSSNESIADDLEESLAGTEAPLPSTYEHSTILQGQDDTFTLLESRVASADAEGHRPSA